MKKKFLFFSIGVVSILSCAAALSFAPTNKVAEAVEPTDLGEVNFTINNNTLTFDGGVHVISDVENPMPYDWSNRLFPAGPGAAIFNGVDMYSATEHRIHICKFDAAQYFICLSHNDYPDYMPSSRTEGDTITVKGDWISTMQGNDYTLTVNEFTATWTNGKWKAEFIIPELEAYDRLSLPNFGLDDYDRQPFDSEAEPNGWNTYVPSAENTTHSFAIEFLFEAHDYMTDALYFRVGSTGAYNTGDFYRLCMNNTWNDNTHGVIILDEIANSNPGTPTHRSNDLPCNLLTGRHTIEFGVIRVKNQTNVYSYVKYDGEYLYQEVYTPAIASLTTKVGACYSGNNIFVGKTIDQSTDTNYQFTFNRGNLADGVYIDGPDNEIPVLGDWKTRGMPASEYNFLRNGDKIHHFSAGNNGPLVKFNVESDVAKYYLAFKDYDISFDVGDVVSIDREFHFYVNGVAYMLKVIPFSVIWDGSGFSPIDLNEYLMGKLNDYVIYDLYDDDKVITLDNILSAAETDIASAISNKARWDIYNEAVADIDNVPMNEEKAQEYLQQVRELAISRIMSYVSSDIYDDAELAQVQAIANDYIQQINNSNNVKFINDLVEQFKEAIKNIRTKQESIEEKILAFEQGYEQYLASYDVITTTDFCATGEMKFTPYGDEEESYGTGGDNTPYSRFANNVNNPTGNLVFQFKYKSTNPSSTKYGSQIFIRLRGSGSNCYRFDVGTETAGVSMMTFERDVPVIRLDYAANLQANTEYCIECGCLDLANYNRVFLYMKIDGTCVMKTIIDRLNYQLLPQMFIMDSHTAEGSGAYATLSALEQGTTKRKYATLAGCPSLGSGSNATALNINVKENTIANNARLYSIETGAFTYNGQETNKDKDVFRLTKTSPTSYSVNISDLNIQDGDTIHIGGCFASYDEVLREKIIYRFFDRDFTYVAATNTWEESEISLEAAKEEAISTLESYRNKLDAYNEENQNRVLSIVEQGIASINDATTVEQVYAILNQALEQLDAIPTILDAYKSNAKQELNSYKSPELFRSEEVAELNSILSNAFARIDACNDTDSIDLIVIETKQAIDRLKTAAEYEAEELEAEKRVARAEVEVYVGLLEFERYSDENAAAIQQLALKARNDINAATSKEEIRQIVETFKQNIKDVKTKDGSIFDGEKYIEKEQKGSTGGCGGEILSSIIIVPIASLVALIVLLVLKKKNYILK